MKTQTITAIAVPTRERLQFLPEFFTPRLMMRAEATIYTCAARLSNDYTGGLWTLYRLSNGGAYVAPETDKRFEVVVEGNGYRGEMSADAFGIVVTLFVFGALVWTDDEALREKFGEHYHQLRAFAMEHDEAAAIFAAID
jgi:hypothetical protein